MAEDTSKRVDAALEQLARDVNAAAPLPGAQLTERVMDAANEQLVGGALARLAEEVNEAAPRPGTDLMARVLADAAAVAPTPADQTMVTTPARPRSLAEILFGWTGGAVAAMALCMSLGFALGTQMPDDRMPMVSSGEVEIAEADPMGVLPEDFI